MKIDNTGLAEGSLSLPRVVDEYQWRSESLTTDSFDPVSLLERVNGDAELLRDLVDLFSQEYPRLLQSLRTAVEQRSAADIQKLSHKLKGSLLQFSGRESVAAAGKLEEMGKAKTLECVVQVFTKLEKAVDILIADLRSMVDPERPVI